MQHPLDFSDKKEETNDCCDCDNCLHHNNSYSRTTITNAKDPELLERTRATYAVVYTQDLRSKHEDRFLLSYTTMANLQDIRMLNPTHRFTAQITVPKDQTIHKAFERMLQNTLSQIADAFVIRICGGSVSNPNDDEAMLPWNGDQKEEVLDLAFAVTNMATKVPVTAFIFSQYSYDSVIDHNKRFKIFDQDGQFLRAGDEPFDEIKEVDSNVAYAYDLLFLTRIIHTVFNRNRKLKYVELNVNYTTKDLSELDDFLKFCKNAQIVCFIGRSSIELNLDTVKTSEIQFGIRCYKQ